MLLSLASTACIEEGRYCSSSQREVKLWRVSDGRVFTLIVGDVDTPAFSADGQLLALSICSEVKERACSQSRIKVWRVADESEVRTTGVYNGKLSRVAFSPDSQLLAFSSCEKIEKSPCTQNKITLQRVADGSEVYTLVTHAEDVYSLAFSPDSQLLSSISCLQVFLSDCLIEELKLRKVSDGGEVRTIFSYADPDVDFVTFSPDGQLIASFARYGGTVELRRAADGSLVRILTFTSAARPFSVDSAAFSSDSKLIAIAGSDERLRFLKVSDGSEVWNVYDSALTSVADADTKLAFTEDGQLLITASGGPSRQITVRQVDDGSVVSTSSLANVVDDISSVAFSPDRQLVAAWSAHDTIKLWRVTDGSEVLTLQIGDVSEYTRQDPITYSPDIAFSPDGQWLAIPLGQEIKLWRVSDGRPGITLQTSGSRTSVVFSPDGQLLLVRAHTVWSDPDDQKISLLRVTDGSLLREFPEHLNYVSTAAFSPDGTLLATGGRDGLAVWRVK